MATSSLLREETRSTVGNPDVVLTTEDGEKILCHRSVLSKNSLYFEAMFSSGFKESNEKQIKIKDVNGLALRMLVDSVYGVPLKLDYDTAFLLVVPAALFQFTTVLELCCSFLSHSVNIDKCIEIFTLADMMLLANLRRQALSYILFNFSVICRETQAFTKCTESQLKDFLSNPALNCKDEFEVFECIILWLEKNREVNLEEKWPALIQCLRFQSMDLNDLRSLACYPAVQESPFVSALLACILAIKEEKQIRICHCQCHGDVPDQNSSLLCDSCKSRCYSGNHGFSIHPETETHSNNLLCCLTSACDDKVANEELPLKEDEIFENEPFHVTDEQTFQLAWVVLNEKPRSLPYVPCVVGHIYSCTKIQESTSEEQPHRRHLQDSREPVLFAIDPNQKKLSILLNLDKANQGPTEATGYKLCSSGKDIYLIGGEYMLGYSNWQKSVWKYDTLTHTWNVETTLPQPRRHHSACVLGHSLYVIGGFGRYRIILNSMDKYDTLKCEWQRCAPLPSSLYSSACCTYQGLIYVFASQAFVYYPSGDFWEVIKDVVMPSDVIFSSAMATAKTGIFLTSATSKFLYWLSFEETPPVLQLVGSFENTVTNSCLDPAQNLIYSFKCTDDDDSNKTVVMEVYDIAAKTFRMQSLNLPSDHQIEDFCSQYSVGCFPLIQFN